LEEKVVAPVQKSENTAVGIRHAEPHGNLYPQTVALTSSTSGGRSVGIVLSRTQATKFSFSITHGDEIFSHKRRPSFNSRKIFVLVSVRD
jgi:hypothetical protein